MTDDYSNLVYSTDSGRLCPNCGNPRNQCICSKKTAAPKGDGIVRVRREIKGRNGKPVTTIQGVPAGEDALKILAGDLKRHCGCGGSVKDHIIMIQGDKTDQVMTFLKNKGYEVKRAGG